MRTVTVLPGDGIGPEVCDAAMRVLLATGAPIEFDVQPIGEAVNGLPEAALTSLQQTKLGLKGPTATPVGAGHRSLNVTLREVFQLYANVRPVQTMPGVYTHYSGTHIDIVLFRENLEDLYIGEEFTDVTGATGFARFTFEGCERIARFAFEWARAHGRKKMTVVHKANIMKKTHGLFLEIARDVASEYPDIECNDLIADNCMMQLVQRPDQFDCILAPNLIGDFLSDLCAGLVGGLGFAPGANIGTGAAIFEAVHGTAPDIAGKGIANPTSLILSGAMLLEHIEAFDAARKLRAAVHLVLAQGNRTTADVNKVAPVSTNAYADALIEELQRS